MRRIAVALIAALCVVLTAAPADAKGPRVTAYKITKAEGFVRVTFQGDEAAGCRERGLCGLSGTTTYAFGGTPRGGELHWFRQGSRTLFVSGFFDTRGSTVSDVGTAGSGERCVDRVRHRIESLSFTPRRGRLRFTWREPAFPIGADAPLEDIEGDLGPDAFDTRCAGPAHIDLARAGAMPAADVPFRLLRSKRSAFTAKGSRPFAGGGFAGTVDWDLSYRFAYRSCNPRCRGGGFVAIFT